MTWSALYRATALGCTGEKQGMCEKYNKSELSEPLEDVLTTFYNKNKAQISVLAKLNNNYSNIETEEDYIEWITGKPASQSRPIPPAPQIGTDTLLFRHAPSLANEIQEQGMFGKLVKKNFVLDPRLFLPPGSQQLIYIPKFAIDNIDNIVKMIDPSAVDIAVSQLKRTWMTALLILSRCKLDKTININLHMYHDLNEVGKTPDNQPTTGTSAVKTQRDKVKQFGEQMGVFNTINYVAGVDKNWRDPSKNYLFAVSHGKRIRELLGPVGSKDLEKFKKIIGNLSICAFSETEFRLVTPGIPKIEITKVLCKGKEDSDDCKAAKEARKMTGDGLKRRIEILTGSPSVLDKDKYKNNFFSCNTCANS